MNVFVLQINNCIVGAFSTTEKIVDYFTNECKLTNLLIEDEELSVEEGVGLLIFHGSTHNCYNENLCERGDDDCALLIEEIKVI